MHHTVFILGRIPELSALEIKEVCAAENIAVTTLSYGRTALFATTDAPLDHAMLMHRLGGTIKIGTVFAASVDRSADLFQLTDLLERWFPDTSKRITFGISAYDDALNFRAIESLGLAIKKELKGRGRSVRFVMPKNGETALSSVVAEKQKLLDESGCEFLFVSNGATIPIARTLAVQPFEEFSQRDWERPAKSMAVGMLPPKLARMMVNCSGLRAGSQEILLDPFCGLGTILQEALLVGMTRVEGSDISTQNIEAAKKNISWISKEKKLPLSQCAVHVLDARKLSTAHAKESIAAIVTEPTLGPIVLQSGIKNLSAIQKELSDLYRSFLEAALIVLKKNGRVVMVFPVWLRGKEKIFLPVLKAILPAGFTAISDPILIARADQHVGRELFIFQKK